MVQQYAISSYLSCGKHVDGLFHQEQIFVPVRLFFQLKNKTGFLRRGGGVRGGRRCSEGRISFVHTVCSGISVVVNSHLRHSSQLLELLAVFLTLTC